MPAPDPRVYIANEDGSDPVYLELVHAPWPEVPKRNYPRQGSNDTMIPGWDGTNKIPGRTIHQDYGVHESSGKIDIEVDYIDETKLAELNEKYALVTSLEYSPNDGWDTWIVKWRPDVEAFDPQPMPGFPGKYRASLKLNVVLKNPEIGS